MEDGENMKTSQIVVNLVMEEEGQFKNFAITLFLDKVETSAHVRLMKIVMDETQQKKLHAIYMLVLSVEYFRFSRLLAKNNTF